MSAAEKNTIRTILIALTVALATWGAKRYDASKLDVSRFVVDSTSRVIRDARRDSLLGRIDERVGKIYCGRLPDSLRAGCQ